MTSKFIYLDLALNQLTLAESSLFQRYCMQGESLEQIAASIPCSVEAARESSCLLRCRLQTLLMEMGFSPGDAREYLYQALTSHP